MQLIFLFCFSGYYEKNLSAKAKTFLAICQVAALFAPLVVLVFILRFYYLFALLHRGEDKQ